MTETIPGGRYLVNGEWVDANGRPVPPPEKPRRKAEKASEPPPDDAPPTPDQE